MTGTQRPAKRTTANHEPSEGFTQEERLAMKERAHELRAAGRRGRRADKAEAESGVVAKIAEMPEPDRVMAERLHAVIKASAPTLSAKLSYGMPAYAKDGKVVCFFQSAQKFKARYATLGFSDQANLDEGAMLADCLRADRVDRRRGGTDRRAREEGDKLTTELLAGRRQASGAARRAPVCNALDFRISGRETPALLPIEC